MISESFNPTENKGLSVLLPPHVRQEAFDIVFTYPAADRSHQISVLNHRLKGHEGIESWMLCQAIEDAIETY
jgi:hypothetical protein